MNELTEMTENNYSNIVVAIDLGSRNIRSMIARKGEDGRLEVLFAKKTPSVGIENGIVINVDEVSFQIKKIIQELRNFVNNLLKNEKEPNVVYDIQKVYVGLHGKSIHGDLNEISRSFGSKITFQDMEMVEAENRRMTLSPGRRIVDVIPFDYIIDQESSVDNPIGCVCQNLRSRFLNVSADNRVEDNLRRCFENVNESVCKDPSVNVSCEPMFVLHSRYMADAVLSQEQKEVGCMLLDFGAQTISMSIYHEKKLRYLHVFNFGSDTITKDIASMQLPWDVSEKLKRSFGSAMPGLASPVIVDLPNGRQMDSNILCNTIESRMRDIMQRVNAAIDLSGYRSVLDSIVLVGGGANLKHLIEFVETETGITCRFGDIRVLAQNTDAKYAAIDNASIMGIMMAAETGSVVSIKKEETVAQPAVKPKNKVKKNPMKSLISLFGNIGENIGNVFDDPDDKE